MHQSINCENINFKRLKARKTTSFWISSSVVIINAKNIYIKINKCWNIRMSTKLKKGKNPRCLSCNLDERLCIQAKCTPYMLCFLHGNVIIKSNWPWVKNFFVNDYYLNSLHLQHGKEKDGNPWSSLTSRQPCWCRLN